MMRKTLSVFRRREFYLIVGWGIVIMYMIFHIYKEATYFSDYFDNLSFLNRCYIINYINWYRIPTRKHNCMFKFCCNDTILFIDGNVKRDVLSKDRYEKIGYNICIFEY